MISMKYFFIAVLLISAGHCRAQLQPVGSGVYHWNELPVKKNNDRESRKLLEGTTAEFSFFEIHASTQQKGAIPRPPHAQKDIEELIIIKEGKLKCKIGDRETELGPGSVLIIPPGVMQSFENSGNSPVTYYVLMFRSKQPIDMQRSEKAGGVLLINSDTVAYTEKNDKGSEKYFDRATAMCERYEMHITTLKKKGPSHAPHQHVETEIMLVISGEVEMMVDGKEYKGGAGDLFIAESGKMHGISNVTDQPCRYFAFKWR
jgi:quercetin dioxygenase-like cupin family protein